MLTREKLADLYGQLRDTKVLSIYLDGNGNDPAERKVWRKELDHEIEGARERLADASAEEKEAFESAVSLLMAEIDDFNAFVPDKGWVGFATRDDVHYAESVPVPLPTLARWEDGLRVAPYVRGLKQDRMVAAVLLDSQRARIFEYRDGELVEPESLRADTFIGDLTDVNISKRAATHTGTRGETGTDAAQRALEVTSERMRKKLMEVVTELVGDKGLLIIGGTPEMVSAAASSVPRAMEGRVAERPSLHLEMTTAEVKEAVETAASELTQEIQSRLVDQVIDQALANGRGCLGRESTERALLERRVDTLLLARSFIDENQDFADHCVGTAFEQHAEVEEVSGEADDRLMEEGSGIGARLRYKIPQEQPEAVQGSEVGAGD
ncbi:MAG: hypothetical protein R3223_00865 [Longimicrobiales bacterium]|nr:hypothetical protein [Longimicrobiales bacterium]